MKDGGEIGIETKALCDIFDMSAREIPNSKTFNAVRSWEAKLGDGTGGVVTF